MTIFSWIRVVLFMAAASLVLLFLYPDDYLRGQIHSREPDRAVSITYFKDFLSRNPYHRGASMALAAAYESVADPESALPVFKILYAHRRGDLKFGQDYLDLLERSGHLEEAMDFRWRLYEDLKNRREMAAEVEAIVYDYYQRALLIQDDAAIIKALGALAALDKKPETFHFEILRHYMARREFNQAAALLKTRIDRKPTDLAAREDLAYVRKEQGDLAAALAQLDEIIALAPRRVSTLLERAALRERKGLCLDALADYETVVRLAPANSGYRRGLASLALKCRPFPEASAVYERLLASHPDDSLLMRDYIFACSDRGRHDVAARWLERMIAARPDDGESVDLLAYQYEKLGRIRESADVLVSYARRRPGDRPRLRRAALALNGQKRFEEARPLLERIVASEPDDREVWIALAYGLGDRKLYSQAAPVFERYLQLFPRDGKAVEDLARLYVELGRRDSAIRLLKGWLKQ